MVYTKVAIAQQIAEFGRLASERNAANTKLERAKIASKMNEVATLRDQMRHHLTYSSEMFGANENGSRGRRRHVQFNTFDSINDGTKWSKSIEQLVVYVNAPSEAEPFKEGLATLPLKLPTDPKDFSNDPQMVHLWDQFTDWVMDTADNKASIYRSSTNPNVVVKIPKA